MDSRSEPLRSLSVRAMSRETREADGGDGFLPFFGFHEVVVEVGVEFFGDSEGGGQERVVVFVGLVF